jgi:Rieske Fe-S protein
MSPEPAESAENTTATVVVESESGPDRRSLMKAAAFVVVPIAGIGTVAACSGSSSKSTPAGGGGSTGAANQVEFTAAEVPVGGGAIKSGVVVTQPVAGTFKAFSAICTHAGCTVNAVAQNKIECPCHQSIYSASDGSVLGGPAPRALTALTATVNGANVDVTGLAS